MVFGWLVGRSKFFFNFKRQCVFFSRRPLGLTLLKKPRNILGAGGNQFYKRVL
jgi:hypothetical protein